MRNVVLAIIMLACTASAISDVKINVSYTDTYEIPKSTIASALNLSDALVSEYLVSGNIVLRCKGDRVPCIYATNSIKFRGEGYENQYVNQNTYILSVGQGIATNSFNLSTNNFVSTNKIDKNLRLLTEFLYAPIFPWTERKLLASSTLTKTITITSSLPNIISASTLDISLFNATTSTVTCTFNGYSLWTNSFFQNGQSIITSDISSLPIFPINTTKVTCTYGSIEYDYSAITYFRQYSNTPPVTITNFYPLSIFDFSHTNKADHVIIVQTNYMSQANTLASYRNQHGLRSMVIPLNSIYDNYNFGFTDARAIRTCLYDIGTRWEVGPKYVVIIGDGSMDYKGYLNNIQGYVPTMSMIDAEGFLRATDAPFADMDGDGALEMIIGRIPISKTNDFNNWFVKMTNFENGVGWKTNGLAMADAIDGAIDFPADSEMVMENIEPTINMQRNYHSGNISATKANTINALNKGSSLFTYFGHAGPTQLGLSGLFYVSDVVSLTNNIKPTFFMSMSCFISDFGEAGSINTPAPQCLGEAMISSNGGACAVWSSCGLVYSAANRQMAYVYTGITFSNNLNRIGDGFIEATHRMVNVGDPTITQSYNLLGDPSTAFWDKNETRGEPYFMNHSLSYSNWIARISPPILYESSVLLGPNSDADGDGASNISEYYAGTNPFNASSILEITGISMNNGISIKWNSLNHKVYAISASTNLLGNYYRIATNIVGLAPSMSITNSIMNSMQFYRVEAN